MSKRTYWAGLLGCGALALLIGLGVGMKSLAQSDAPQKEPPKPADKPADKKPQPPAAPDLFGDLDDFFKDLPDGVDKDQLKKMFEMQRQMLQNLPNRGFGGNFGGNLRVMPFGQLNNGRLITPARPEEARLGVMASSPSETLVEQLDLPKGQGLVIEEVVKDSAADKAGLKAHDILLEVDGKAVPDDVLEFKKTLKDVKADTPVDAVVLRKGKKETVKGLKLPEAKAEKPAQPNFPGVPNVPNVPGVPFNFQFNNGGLGGGAPGRVVSISRNGDQFSATETANGTTYGVTGAVADTQAVPSEIKVTEAGKEPQTFDALSKVPEAHKDAVKSLLRMVEKGKAPLRP